MPGNIYTTNSRIKYQDINREKTTSNYFKIRLMYFWLQNACLLNNGHNTWSDNVSAEEYPILTPFDKHAHSAESSST